MSTVRKTITVTDQQDNFIKSKIEAGYYTNDSEFVRDLIRREQDRESDIAALRAVLLEAEESGEAESFDLSEFKKSMAKELAQGRIKIRAHG